MDNIDLDALALIGARAAINVCGCGLMYHDERVPCCDPRIKREDAPNDCLCVLEIKAALTAIDLPAIIKRAKAEAYEDAARLCDRQAEGRQAQKVATSNRTESRDYQTMAMQAIHDAYAIRQRAGEA